MTGSKKWVLGFACVFLCTCGPRPPGNDDGGLVDGACGSGQVLCGASCANLNSDHEHCGRCDVACAANEVCDGAGHCNVDCSGTTTNCDGVCLDLTSDPANCGACGHPCAVDETCTNRACVPDSCTETSATAQTTIRPADIIVAVDNSGSMSDEAAFVQASMNDFVAAILASGIDAHVVLLSDTSQGSNGICVPAPLGSGTCPADENLPTFRHVPQFVASNNALDLILQTYPQWQASLRPEATKTIAVISDDNSSLGAAAFSSMLVALDPTFQNFKFDAIVAPYELFELVCALCNPLTGCQLCDACCGVDSGIGLFCVGLPAAEGVVYKSLVTMTNGVLGNLCSQNFTPVFQDMATAVIDDAQLPCVYEIPPPPMGMIDFTRVNVEFKPNPNSPAQRIPNVPGGLPDCGPMGGWYYDNPNMPTQVLFCPATCALVQSAPDGEVNVVYGCTTVIVE